MKASKVAKISSMINFQLNFSFSFCWFASSDLQNIRQKQPPKNCDFPFSGQINSDRLGGLAIYTSIQSFRIQICPPRTRSGRLLPKNPCLRTLSQLSMNLSFYFFNANFLPYVCRIVSPKKPCRRLCRAQSDNKRPQDHNFFRWTASEIQFLQIPQKMG